MTSLRAAATIGLMRLTNQKKFYTDVDTMHRKIPSHQRASKAIPPRRLTKRYTVRKDRIRGFDCFTISNPADSSGPHFLHLHGGGYVEEIERHHWRFAERLVRDLGATVTLPIYPLAPRYDHTDTLPMVETAYDFVVEQCGPDRLIVSGDSAGGGLTLAIAQRLRARGQPQPAQLMTFSPWMDVTLPDPLSEWIDPYDPMLGVEGLREAGRLYANGADHTDPEISPDYADLRGLAPLNVFIGTRDVLLPESRRLRDNAAAAGIDVHYAEYPGMFHNWIMMPIPEADTAMHEVENRVRTGVPAMN